MRYLALALGLVALCTVGGCEEDSDPNTDRDTGNDPFGDIASLDDLIYATNDDRSGHVGSQVGLFPFALDGTPAGAELVLDLNGCGYLSMTADGVNLLLQVRDTGRVISVSPTGELRWVRMDAEMMDAGWRACGICRRPGADEVVALYTRSDSTFVARTYNLDLSEVVATTDEFAWDDIPGTVFPRTLVHDGSQWVVLAATADGTVITLALGDDFDDLGTPVTEAETVTGLAVADGWFYAAHANGTVARLRQVDVR